MRGQVKWFNDQKGYGFILPEDGGKDLFVHKSQLSGVRTLAEGQEVTFTPGEGRKGPEAREVRAA